MVHCSIVQVRRQKNKNADLMAHDFDDSFFVAQLVYSPSVWIVSGTFG